MGPSSWSTRSPSVRALTDKPFGVDLLTALPGPGRAQASRRSSTAAARVFVAGLGVPRDVIDLLPREQRPRRRACAARSATPIAAVASGCDFVVAQGTEAGGHTGQVATMALVPQVVDAVGDRVPVVAAGGLFDGRGLAAALALGADGVWIGTRFIATPEARAVHGYKDALLAHRRGRHGRSASAYTGKTCRVVRNEWTTALRGAPRRAAAVPAAGVRRRRRPASTTSAAPSGTEVDADREFMPARPGRRRDRRARPAGELVQRVRRRGREGDRPVERGTGQL